MSHRQGRTALLQAAIHWTATHLLKEDYDWFYCHEL